MQRRLCHDQKEIRHRIQRSQPLPRYIDTQRRIKKNLPPVPKFDHGQLRHVLQSNIGKEKPKPSKLKINKHVHWNRDLPQLYNIESSYPDPEFNPTPSLESQNYGERSHRRSQRTGRSKLYRDQLTDVVTTLHQLSAKNRKVCLLYTSPSPRD